MNIYHKFQKAILGVLFYATVTMSANAQSCPPSQTLSTAISNGSTTQAANYLTVSGSSTFSGSTNTNIYAGHSITFSPGSQINLSGSAATFNANIHGCSPFNFDCETDECTNTTFNNWSKTSRWHWSADGYASSAPFWNGRTAIQSKSLNNGAFALYPPNVVNNYNDTLTSLVYNNRQPDASGNIYLSFHEYFRNHSGTTQIDFSINGGTTWDTILVNTEIESYYETAKYRQVIVPIPVSGTVNIQIRFVTAGKLFYWLVDDIKICDKYPSPTLPNPALGEYLFNNGYDFEVDFYGHPYVKNELVAKFEPGTTNNQKQTARKRYNVADTTTCVCDSIEKWVFQLPNLKEGENGNFPTAIEEKVKGALASTNETSEPSLSLNYYYDSDPSNANCNDNPPHLEASLNPAVPSNKMIIAILDSGRGAMNNQSYVNINATTDGNCLSDDYSGYNFIDLSDTPNPHFTSNNPLDDNGHGSHVFGIIRKSINALNPPNIKSIRYLSVKTSDKGGVGTVFSGACGIYYAASQGAKVINCSWGYHDSSLNKPSVMSDAIKFAASKNAMVVCSAGNNSIEIAEPDLHFPSSYCANNPNVISVAALKKDFSGLLESSNYSETFVSIAALGDNVVSDLNCGGIGIKSGTSMAAPVISAIVAKYYNDFPEFSVGNIRSTFFNFSCGIPLHSDLSTGRYLEIVGDSIICR